MQFLFKTFQTSIAEPKKYKALIKLSSRKIFGYFVFWMAVIGFSLGIYTQFSEIPKLKVELEQTRQHLVESYPEDLKISWSEAGLATAPHKYHEFKTEFSPNGSENKIGFEYQNKNLNIEELPTTSDLKIIVDRTNVYTPNPEGWAAIELSSLPHFESGFGINHENIDEISVNTLKKIIESIDKSTSFVYLFFISFIVITRILVSLFYSIMIYLMGKILNFPKNWKQSWSFSMLVIVLSEMVSQIANLSYKTLNIPMFSLSFWLITGYIFFVNFKKPSVKGA